MPHPPISFLLPTHPAQVCAGKTRVATPKADKLKGDREEKQRIKKKNKNKNNRCKYEKPHMEIETHNLKIRGNVFAVAHVLAPCPYPVLPGQPQGTTNSFVLRPSRQVKGKSEKRRQ